MQNAAILWHLHSLTGSAAALGMLGLYRMVAIATCSFVGGAIADTADRRRVLIVTQTLMCLTAAALALLTATHRTTAATIYVVVALGATLASFANPARQALVPNLVPREHFGNAVSLTSISHQIAGIVGPTAAGILIGYGNLSATYWVNAASFTAVIGALVAMPPYPVDVGGEPPPDRSMRAALDGFRFVFRTPVLAWTMVLDFLATFFSSASALLPIFATQILRADARGYGALWAAESIGAMAAGGYMALRSPPRRQGLTILLAVACYGAATVLFGLSRWFWLTWLALCIVGGSDTVSTILRQTIRQLITPDRMRGRMTAVNMVFVMGGPQLGNLEAGVVADLTSAPFSVVTGGLGCILATAFIAARAGSLRRYECHTSVPGLRDEGARGMAAETEPGCHGDRAPSRPDP